MKKFYWYSQGKSFFSFGIVHFFGIVIGQYVTTIRVFNKSIGIAYNPLRIL
jgi:hypothetical protein